MLRASDERLPSGAPRRLTVRSATAVLVAVATVIALTGLAGPGSSAASPVAGGSVQLGNHLTAVGIDGVVGFSGVTAAPAPHGQRATPGALPALLPLALVMGLLLALATSAPSTRWLALQRLPSRRAPPQHAFSR